MLSLGELPPLLKRARVIVDGDVRETVRDTRPSTSVMACRDGVHTLLSQEAWDGVWGSSKKGAKTSPARTLP
jgi:hypothetical protein